MDLLHWNSWLLSKRGNTLQKLFSKNKLRLKITLFFRVQLCFSEYKAYKEVFSDMFINAYNPLF